MFCKDIYMSNLDWIIHIVGNNNVIAVLIHWMRATHICMGNLTIVGSDNVLTPGRRQAIM